MKFLSKRSLNFQIFWPSLRQFFGNFLPPKSSISDTVGKPTISSSITTKNLPKTPSDSAGIKPRSRQPKIVKIYPDFQIFWASLRQFFGNFRPPKPSISDTVGKPTMSSSITKKNIPKTPSDSAGINPRSQLPKKSENLPSLGS